MKATKKQMRQLVKESTSNKGNDGPGMPAALKGHNRISYRFEVWELWGPVDKGTPGLRILQTAELPSI